jgi:hypothetical protein
MRERDMDELRDAADERARQRRMTGCRCGADLPGRCPGPVKCDFSGVTDPIEVEYVAIAGIYRATRDSYEPGDVIGEGRTEEEAIEDLMEREADRG